MNTCTRCWRLISIALILVYSSTSFASGNIDKIGVGAGPIAGTGGGAIPDGTGAVVNVNFNVAGLTGQIDSVVVALDITHTWVGDLTATLYSPGELAKLKLFGRVGSGRMSGFGDSSNLSGIYSFGDFAAQDLWLNAALVGDASAVTTGTYRASTGGTGNIAVAQRTNVGGCSTHLNLAFGGLQGSQMNGVWRLEIRDSASPDAGTVNAATSSLQINTVPALPEGAFFRSGFEVVETSSTPNPIPPVLASDTIGACTPGINSPTGSGLTDFILVRALDGNVEWRIKKNDATAVGPEDPPYVFGKDTDFFVMGDFDGDGASDATVFSTGAPGRFKVRRSSRPNDVPLEVLFGQNGDDPTIIADFDGDRVSDFVVYRDGTPTDTTAHFLIRKSSTGLTSDFPVSNSDGGVAFTIKDINSDGRADFGVQFNNGGGVGGFRMFSGLDGAALGATFNFGLSSDFVIPGDFVGDTTTDIAVSRNANPGTGTVKYGFPRDMATGVGDATTLATGIVFGISGDFITQGDFDGDGLVDFAVWRSNATPGLSKFILRRSTNTGTPLEVFMGASGDYPVNNWDVH